MSKLAGPREIMRKPGPVQIAFNARVQEKNAFVILSCSRLNTISCLMSVRV